MEFGALENTQKVVFFMQLTDGENIHITLKHYQNKSIKLAS